MISADAQLSIQRIGLECIQVREYQQRYLEKLLTYIQLLLRYPEQYAGLLFVTPSDSHPGMYALLDGHHKFVASIMTGRRDALCVVVRVPTLEQIAKEQAKQTLKGHDGKLHGDAPAAIRFDEYCKGKYRITITDDFHDLWLEPKQALSLFAWLKQEEATLEQLVKESYESSHSK